MLLEALLGKPCSQRHPEVASGAQKQKFCLGCNFFAIRDCCNLPNRGLLPKKSGENGCVEAYCRVARVEGSCQSQKSCKKVEIFVFAMGGSLQRAAFVGKRAR